MTSVTTSEWSIRGFTSKDNTSSPNITPFDDCFGFTYKISFTYLTMHSFKFNNEFIFLYKSTFAMMFPWTSIIWKANLGSNLKIQKTSLVSSRTSQSPSLIQDLLILTKGFTSSVLDSVPHSLYTYQLPKSHNFCKKKLTINIMI